eukprot:TRINITY_DN12409_c0_g1_i1.p1 TRINITY_DN12409_c0_g1~~TRINITY_DN12409_c0_g1_i1.p1  ORF type:complete len:767 (+),score=89.90 TRINITY_DN12409_c0_g1_i1:1418-3718(+)
MKYSPNRSRLFVLTLADDTITRHHRPLQRAIPSITTQRDYCRQLYEHAWTGRPSGLIYIELDWRLLQAADLEQALANRADGDVPRENDLAIVHIFAEHLASAKEHETAALEAFANLKAPVQWLVVSNCLLGHSGNTKRPLRGVFRSCGGWCTWLAGLYYCMRLAESVRVESVFCLANKLFDTDPLEPTTGVLQCVVSASPALDPPPFPAVEHTNWLLIADTAISRGTESSRESSLRVQRALYIDSCVFGIKGKHVRAELGLASISERLEKELRAGCPNLSSAALARLAIKELQDAESRRKSARETEIAHWHAKQQRKCRRPQDLEAVRRQAEENRPHRLQQESQKQLDAKLQPGQTRLLLLLITAAVTTECTDEEDLREVVRALLPGGNLLPLLHDFHVAELCMNLASHKWITPLLSHQVDLWLEAGHSVSVPLLPAAVAALSLDPDTSSNEKAAGIQVLGTARTCLMQWATPVPLAEDHANRLVVFERHAALPLNVMARTAHFLAWAPAGACGPTCGVLALPCTNTSETPLHLQPRLKSGLLVDRTTGSVFYHLTKFNSVYRWSVPNSHSTAAASLTVTLAARLPPIKELPLGCLHAVNDTLYVYVNHEGEHHGLWVFSPGEPAGQHILLRSEECILATNYISLVVIKDCVFLLSQSKHEAVVFSVIDGTHRGTIELPQDCQGMLGVLANCPVVFSGGALWSLETRGTMELCQNELATIGSRLKIGNVSLVLKQLVGAHHGMLYFHENNDVWVVSVNELLREAQA